MQPPRDPIPAPYTVQPHASEQSLLTVGWISYALHLIVAVAAVIPSAQASVGLLAIALILDLIKRSDAEGSWQASHFRWRIRSVLWAGVLYLLTAPLWLLLLVPGWIAWSLISLWFLYRILLGMFRLGRRQPMESSGVV